MTGTFTLPSSAAFWRSTETHPDGALAWLSALVAAGTGVAVLLAALTFLPASAWESFVPIATALTAGVFAAALLAAWAGERLARPLRTMVRAIEADTIGPRSGSIWAESGRAGRGATFRFTLKQPTCTCRR